MMQRRLLNSALNGTSVSPLSLLLWLRNLWRRGRKIIDPKVVENCKGTVFWAQQAGCTHDLGACDSTRQHAQALCQLGQTETLVQSGRGHKVPPVTEDVLIIDSCQVRELTG